MVTWMNSKPQVWHFLLIKWLHTHALINFQEVPWVPVPPPCESSAGTFRSDEGPDDAPLEIWVLELCGLIPYIWEKSIRKFNTYMVIMDNWKFYAMKNSRSPLQVCFYGNGIPLGFLEGYTFGIILEYPVSNCASQAPGKGYILVF